MTSYFAANDYRAKTYDVFVSYKREDDSAREVLVLALESAGYEVFWDAKLNNDDWKGELRDEINRCKLVICLWSEKAAASEYVKAEAYGAFQLKKLLSAPIEDKTVVPEYCRNTNLHPFDGWADQKKRRGQIQKILETLQRMTGGPSGRPAASTAIGDDAGCPADFGDIPGAPDKLIGRDAELAMLHDAWESRTPRKVNAVVLHALGGAGKSALLRWFANELLAAGGGGASRIYGWSAYSQGSGEQKRADADSFISKALGDFGYPGELPKDPVERGRALAKLIQKERVLLLLDGLEPLQDAPNVNRGKFKDKGLAELVKLLAGHNPGLVVLTTRQEVPELVGFGSVVINHELDQLSDHAGADLLVELGVHGRQRELEAAVHELDGHALSVTLLGAYLAEVCGGAIRHKDQFDFAHIVLSPEEQSELLTDKTIIPAKRAAKVMQGYLAQFEKPAQDAGAERAILNLLGLFDRPADGPAVDALLTKHIPGLTDALFFDGSEPLPEAKRAARLLEAKRRLRKLRLLSKANPEDLHELDAHPVVRAFCTGRLEEAPEAARAAHEILYRHYSAVAPDLPDTLEQMQPLFHAIQHGVKAGHAQEAFHRIYLNRIQRGNEFYSYGVLGIFGADLATLAHFFRSLWTELRSELDSKAGAAALARAGFALTALGRLSNSVEPRRAALNMRIAQQDWRNAANNGNELADTLFTLGRVTEAGTVVEQALINADRSSNWQMRCSARTSVGQTRALLGELDCAYASFAEAEEIQVQNSNEPQLYSFQGYQYGDLILARRDAEQALARGSYQLDVAKRGLGHGLGLHNIGLGHLLIGRAQDALGNAEESAASLDAAVAGFRKAGVMQLLPPALLARAAHRRRRAAAGETDLIEGIRADLAEVEDIAGDEMRLYLTDLALERARLALDVPAAFASPEAARAEAEAQTAKAAALIADTGYHRRDGELAELKARLAVPESAH